MTEKLDKPVEKDAVEAEKKKEAHAKEAASLQETVEETAAKHKAFVDKSREEK
jgi:hypothetical protein